MDTSPSVVGATQAIATGQSVPNSRTDTTRALVTQQAHPRFRELVSRGNVFGGMTAVTGVSVASLTIGTTAPFCLFNPKLSTVRLSVLKVTMAYVSGTYGAGGLFYVVNNNSGAAAVTGTAITTPNALVGGTGTVNGLLFTTATLPASPTVVDNFCNLYAGAAATANPPTPVIDYLDGLFEILPGCSLSIEGVTAAGTSPLVTFGMYWEEIPNIA